MDPATIGLIGAAAISTAGQLYANARNIKYQEGANDSQIALANTAHQREVRDLEAAGLNPILSAQSSGAPVPQLTAPNIDNPTEGVSSALKAASALNSRQVNAQIDLSHSQEEVNSAQAQNLRHDGLLKKVQADLLRKGLRTADKGKGLLDSLANVIGSSLGEGIESVNTAKSIHAAPVPKSLVDEYLSDHKPNIFYRGRYHTFDGLRKRFGDDKAIDILTDYIERKKGK